MKQKEHNIKDLLKPWIVSAALLPLIAFFILNKGKFNVVDYINILIHEGGHGVFNFFGKFIYTLGGTLMQIIIPGLFIAYFAVNRKRFGVQISLLWLGENFMNIGVYAADARAHKLPLLGGSKVYHDWTYVLGEIGLLNSDRLIGDIFYYLGVIVFVISFLMPLIMRNYKHVNLQLDLYK